MNNDKQITLDVFHREDIEVKTGDIVATTTSEFNFDGVCFCFDNEATECTTILARHFKSDYSEYVEEKSRTGGCYGFDYYIVEDANPTVEFECHYNEECVEGYIYLNEADDEAPLRFYDNTGQEQWNFPSNPYPENLAGSYDKHVDYEILRTNFNSTDIIQHLVDNAAETNKRIVIETDDECPTVLVIN